uniref:LAGLIDADG endonuclease domain-containing protein n=1 Tax=Uncinula necator TaxID=52586 RepID=A0A7U1BF06_UNCNE|nr:LAGLIDADG endonuclease domain-containing protein [Erysiphe necator]QQY98209.1 LAGLIDADG endonuclease domain-containing protein [Erysiphe necator]
MLSPVVKITFVEKDAPLAKKIKEVLNGGSLVYPKNSNYLDLLFQDLNSTRKMAVLLNGKMRTPKIEALHRLIDFFNARLNEKPKMIKLGLDNSPMGNNPWLAGFLEADGNFYCGLGLNSEGITKGVKSYMRVSQKQSYKNTSYISEENNSNFLIMEKIREYLDVKTVTKINRTKEKYVELSYEVRTNKKTSCDLLIKYLSVYPLFSSKHLDFLDWREFHRIRLSREYLTIEGTSKLIYLKNSMNTKRTQFNWDSLNNFYC